MTSQSYIQAPPFISKIFSGYEGFSVSQKMEKLLFFYFCSLMSGGALLWGCICVFFGHNVAALIPFSYVLLTGVNFVVCSIDGGNMVCTRIQVFASICLPFVFQYFLGGIANSGFVMLWSILALLGSMAFQERKSIVLWIALFLALCTISFMYESSLVTSGSSSIPVVLTALNLILVSVIIFSLCHTFVNMQSDLREVLSQQKKRMHRVNEQMELDLGLAKKFQNLLQYDVVSQKIFADKFIFKPEKERVDGNFHWQGDFLHKKVAVFVGNPHSGVRGGMEAMMLWNLVENSVAKAEVQSPEHLIEIVQRALYSRYDIEALRTSMRDVDIAVVCHDTLKNELAYASTGTKLIINAGEERKLLCGFDKSRHETTVSGNGTEIVIGKLMPYPCAKVLFVNETLLSMLEIDNNLELKNTDNALKPLFEWSFEIGEKELRRKFVDCEERSDYYLLGIQL